MEVFLTGATGFVGRAVLERLIESGYKVRCLVRPRSLGRFQSGFGARGDSAVAVVGDCLEPATFREALRGCEAAIHLVGIIRALFCLPLR